MTHPRPDRLVTLDAIGDAVWHELDAAVHDAAHAWHTPVLATADASGRPDARTVVLREVDGRGRRVAVYSDARAGKVAQLRDRGEAMLVCWSPALSWQLRLTLQVEVHVEGLAAASRWARLRLSRGAQDYLAPLPPGTPLPHGPAAAASGHGHAPAEAPARSDGGHPAPAARVGPTAEPTPEPTTWSSTLDPSLGLDPKAVAGPAAQRAHFAMLEAQVVRCDWLELAPRGHRRAVFDADGARWVQP